MTQHTSAELRISSIRLIGEDFGSYRAASGETLDVLGEIGRVNVFVGSNNSGKSRFIRSLARGGASGYQVGFSEEQVDLVALQKAFVHARKMIGRMMGKYNGLKSAGPVSVNRFVQLRVPEFFALAEKASEEIASVQALVQEIQDARHFMHLETTGSPGNYTPPDDVFDNTVRDVANDLQSALTKVPHDLSHLKPGKLVYIPSMRGLRPLAHREPKASTNGDSERRPWIAEGGDLYYYRTAEDYFPDESTRPRIFSGVEMYEGVRNRLLGNREERDQIRAFEEFLAIELFDGKRVELIPHRDHDTLVVKIGDESERPIYQLGDGVQQVIILTFLHFTFERAFFFVEEPELFLHPGLQRKVLKVFADPKSPHTYFVTTHSNHFLDMSLEFEDIAVYSFAKKLKPDADDDQTPEFWVEQREVADRSTLALLGVRNSSVFLVNATIWVEGITDRLYFRRLLERYQERTNVPRRFTEDLHYSFVEYAGSNITHFSFLDSESEEEPPIEVQRLCGHALLIADSDKNKDERHERLKTLLGDRFVLLPCKEVENLLPPSVLKAVVTEYEDTATAFPDFEWEDYAREPLGKFIEVTLLRGERKRRGSYSDKHENTVSDKLTFCRRAVDAFDAASFEELDDEVKAVVRRIYEHVRIQNDEIVPAGEA